MKFPKKEVTIGLCVLLALGVLIFGVNYLKGVNLFKAANYYYAEYDNAAGLQVSAPVSLNGFKVGQVRSISYEYDNPGHVKVELALDRKLKVPAGSKAIIEQDILGTSAIVLHMSGSSEYEKVGATLSGETAKGLMDNVSQNLMPGVSAIFLKIDSLLTSINALVGDPALLASVKRLDAITRSMEATMAQLNKATASLPATMGNVNAISGNLNTVSSDLASFSGELEKMPIDSIMDNVNALSANLRQLSEELDNPESTLGLITHDRALYDNLNGAAASLDSLLIDVKKNPKRYISIKLL